MIGVKMWLSRHKTSEITFRAKNMLLRSRHNSVT